MRWREKPSDNPCRSFLTAPYPTPTPFSSILKTPFVSSLFSNKNEILTIKIALPSRIQFSGTYRLRSLFFVCFSAAGVLETFLSKFTTKPSVQGLDGGVGESRGRRPKTNKICFVRKLPTFCICWETLRRFSRITKRWPNYRLSCFFSLLPSVFSVWIRWTRWLKGW